MVTQLRIYKIKDGMMDEWLEYFTNNLVPVHKKLGIPMLRGWVTHDTNEFVWMRQFDSVEAVEQKEREYYSSPERAALGDGPSSFIDKMEIRLILPVFDNTNS